LQKEISYPQFRKYKNGLSYFKILSPDLCYEIKKVGSKSFLFTIEAKQYPEKVFIQDLLFNYQGFALEINAEEYEYQLQ